jgi:polyphosphate kinase
MDQSDERSAERNDGESADRTQLVKKDREHPERYNDRELSWLSFNYRILQEANDPRVPLFERVRFLAIYSSNLDEFFRVRVASIRSLLRIKKKSRKKLEVDPDFQLERIHARVRQQQEVFGVIFREQLLPALRRHGIRILMPNELDEEQIRFVDNWFDEHAVAKLNAAFIRAEQHTPFLKSRHLYLVVELRSRIGRQSLEEGQTVGRSEVASIALVEISTETLPRYITLPSPEGQHHVIILDDLLRVCLDRIFPGFDPIDAWSVKLTRDAELYIDDEFAGDLLKKIRKGLRTREDGIPSRFLYDEAMPDMIVRKMRAGLELSKEDLVPGGRYHNFSDLFDFPFPETDSNDLVYPAMPPQTHPALRGARSMFPIIASHDLLLHFPYQTYEHVIDFLKQAAEDRSVREIFITLYRVAAQSAITRQLIIAARQGKSVTVFVELKARFDEESNLYWAGEMEKVGVRVLYSFPGLKVHSKLCLVGREEKGVMKDYVYLGTGNFNEKTSKLYCDHALFTADTALSRDVRMVFDFLGGETLEPTFDQLLVAPFNLRSRLIGMIDDEIAVARTGEEASILLKVNSLEDREMIDKLYEASDAGVRVRLIVRGICCLQPGVEGMSDGIDAISIIDRFLEHARVFMFHNGGDEKWYVGSADWMQRNLNRRVEVVFPLKDRALREEIRTILEFQWRDNCRARWLNEGKENLYRTHEGPPIRAQVDTYYYLKEKVTEPD